MYDILLTVMGFFQANLYLDEIFFNKQDIFYQNISFSKHHVFYIVGY